MRERERGIVNTYVNHQASRDNQARESKSITHFLHGHTGGSEGWRCDIRSTVIVEHTAHDNIDRSNAGLTGDEGTRKLLGLSHFRHDREKCRRSCVGEDNGGNGRDGRPKVRVAHDFEIRNPGNNILGGIDRAILHSDRNNDNNDCIWYESQVRPGNILGLPLTGGDNARHTTPRHPGNLAQGLNTPEPKSNNSSNGDESGRTDGVSRQGV